MTQIELLQKYKSNRKEYSSLKDLKFKKEKKSFSPKKLEKKNFLIQKDLIFKKKIYTSINYLNKKKLKNF